MLEKEEKSKEKGSRWAQLAIWKKKEETESVSHKDKKASTVALLKSDAEFKDIQKKIDIFFDHLFEVQLPEDLKSFAQIM